jgi:hypothetical protein
MSHSVTDIPVARQPSRIGLLCIAGATALMMIAGFSAPSAAPAGIVSPAPIFAQNMHNPPVTRILHRGKLRMLSGISFPQAAPPPVNIAQMPHDERPRFVARIGEQHGVPGEIFAAMVMTESNFNPAARSHVGAIGLTQLMPATAREIGVNPHDPMQNLQGGARYLKEQYDRFGEWPLALAAYNSGPTRVARLGRIPRIRETQDYVRKVLTRADVMRGKI